MSDLLSGTSDLDPEDHEGRNLSIRQDGKGGVFVDKLTEACVAEVSQAQTLLNAGAKRKKMSKTNMNDSSSRSHTVFTLIVKANSRSQVH